MTPLFPTTRAAEEFAAVVDGTASPESARRFAELAGTVAVLREQPLPVPDAAFVADLRGRLLAAADELLVPTHGSSVVVPLRPRRARHGERHLGAAAAALLLVGGTAGIAAASQGSLPGDALYPVKRGIESAELRLTPGDAAKGRDLLDQAGTRLDELHAVLTGPGASVDQINQSLADFNDSASRGSDLIFTTYRANGDGADIAAVRTFAAQHMTALAALEQLAPPTTSPAFDRAAESLAEIDQQARVLCVACSAAPPLALPSNLVAPSSAPALATLVSAPAVRADNALRIAAAARAQVQSEAAAAEAAARSLGSTATGTTGTGSTGTGTSGGVTLSRQPIGDLVQGLSSSLPSVPGDTSTSGGTLGDTTSKATDGVTGTLDGVTGTLGDTVDGTLGGLTGGSTTP